MLLLFLLAHYNPNLSHSFPKDYFFLLHLRLLTAVLHSPQDLGNQPYVQTALSYTITGITQTSQQLLKHPYIQALGFSINHNIYFSLLWLSVFTTLVVILILILIASWQGCPHNSHWKERDTNTTTLLQKFLPLYLDKLQYSQHFSKVRAALLRNSHQPTNR